MELATGMHYLEGGEWKETRELIEPFEGGAVARFGQHKVSFADNLNSAGAIDLEMPDGNRLRSQVLGLAYYDTATGKSVLIAEVRDCQGQILGSNQVLYADAFTGLAVDVRYIYTRSGFEQDIIFRVQPPSATEFGLNPNTTRLQVLTEFLNPPAPTQNSQELSREKGVPMPDVSLDFGTMTINEGRTFALEDQAQMIAPIAKQWQMIQNRHFLIEEVELSEISRVLARLPSGASLDSTKGTGRLAAVGRQLPAPRSATRKTGRMLTASLVPQQPGVVLDYLITLTGKSNFTLQGDTTYYVNGAVLLSGTTTIEGNTVVKFSSANSARIRFSGPVVCKTGPYRPAIFTAEDDNTVGVPFGTIYAPVGYYSCGSSRDAALSLYPPSNLSHIRMSYLRNAIVSGGGSPSVTYSNCQFVNCLNGIGMTSAGSLNLRNVLFSNVRTNFNDLGYSGSIYLNAQHVTFDAADCMVTRYGGAVNMTLKNCVLASVIDKNLSSESSYVFWSGDCNGFYHSPNATFGTPQIPSLSNPFQTSDGGKHYLATGSNFRGAGTTTVDATLLDSLKSKSTQPPIAFPAFMEISGELTLFPQVARYTSGPPDLGYHYDTIDFTVAGLVSSGATITVKPGTVVATRQEPIFWDYTEYGELWTWSVVGIWLDGSSSFVSHGTPANRNTFVAIRLVQEDLPPLPDVDMIEPHSPEFDLFVPNAVDAESTPTLDFRFCDFSVPPFAFHFWSGRLYHNYASFLRSTSSAIFWRLQDCNLNSGRILLGVPQDYDGDYGAGSVTWFNNLFARVDITLDPCQFVPRAEEPNGSPINVDLEFVAYNNLFRGGRMQLNPIPATGHDWLLRDNLFDKVAFQQFANQADGAIGPLDHNYNAYWPRTAAELETDPWYVDHLLANTTDRSPNDTANNRELALSPAYQTGPLGDFYLATSSELYSTSPDKRGSRTVAEAGLYHYTTRFDQTKDGAQTGNVIIGRHYVATASSGSTQPKDSDAPTPDGIPDYVENWHGDGDTGVSRIHGDDETDWNNPTTDTDPNTSMPIADSGNAKYNDIDLDGDGLTGFGERALSRNPLVQANPLTITEIGSEEPYVRSFLVTASSPVLSSGISDLALSLDGRLSGLSGISRLDGDTFRIDWNTLGSLRGLHFIQVSFPPPPVASASEATTPPAVFGPPLFVVNDTPLAYDYTSQLFGSQLRIAGSSEANLDYEIQIRTVEESLVKTIPGMTDNQGEFQQIWDLIPDGSSEPLPDNVFKVTITLDPSASQNGWDFPVVVPLPDFMRSKMVNKIGTGTFTLAYGWHDHSADNKRSAMIQHGVTDIIFNPALDNEYHNTPLNTWHGSTFFLRYRLPELDHKAMLLADMLNAEHFFFCGHGNGSIFGSLQGDMAPEDEEWSTFAFITSQGLADHLNNNFRGARGWTAQDHPYRLVIINACRSWAHIKKCGVFFEGQW